MFWTFVRYICCKYFLPFCDIMFSFNGGFWWTEVLPFTFRCAIHLKLIFNCGMWSIVNFFYPCKHPIDPALLIEKITLFWTECIDAFVLNQMTRYMWVYKWILHSVPLISLFILSLYYIVLLAASLIIGSFPTLFYSFKIVLVCIAGFLVNFKINFSVYTKTTRIFTGIILAWILFMNMVHLSIYLTLL